MNRNEVAADLIVHLQNCFGSVCDYEYLRARGVPPADCDSIALVWGDRTTEYDEDCDTLHRCRQRRVTQDLQIVLTKICVGPDADRTFDFRGEDTETICFEDDISVVEQCLECTDWSQFGADHGVTSIKLTTTSRDFDVEGGGATAYFDIEIVYEDCCIEVS